MKTIIEVDKISMKYGCVLALNNLHFHVEENEIYGIIGPDGSGKTSLFHVLNTLSKPDAGNLYINNLNANIHASKIRKHIGYMPGKFSLYPDLTIEENLSFFAHIYNVNIDDNFYLIEDVYKQIEPFRKRKSKELSGGMKQKLALCCALIHNPDILLLDEPTTGVDPISRKEIWRLLYEIRNNKKTIIVATPYMDEAKLCDRISLIKKGSFLKTGAPEDLIRQYQGVLLSISSSDNISQLLLDIREHPLVDTCFAFGGELHATSRSTEFSIERLRNFLVNRKHKKLIIKKIEASIEDCYIQLVVQ